MSDDSERRDLLAAEYVLGLLDQAGRRDVEQRAARDPGLAEAIANWQRDLEPLANIGSPSPPPAELWQRIEATLDANATPGPARARSKVTAGLRRRIAIWRTAALTFGAAAALACILLFRAHADRPVALGVMLARDNASDTLPVIVTASGQIEVRPRTPIKTAAGQRLDLWAKPELASEPVLLGELPPTGGAVSFAGLATDVTTVMITSDPREPAGVSSPGPTLFQGVLASIRP
jgi:anti-sigma-K factor RskA